MSCALARHILPRGTANSKPPARGCFRRIVIRSSNLGRSTDMAHPRGYSPDTADAQVTFSAGSDDSAPVATLAQNDASLSVGLGSVLPSSPRTP